MLIGILQLIGDADAPYAIVRRLLDAMPSGSRLAVAHPAGDVQMLLEQILGSHESSGMPVSGA
jgi:hypothetical protein